MNENMTIDVDAKGRNFLIRCPLWCNDLVRNLPSRRWSKTARAWVAPILRQNVTEVGRLVSMAGVAVTAAAVNAIAAHRERLNGHVKTGFPAWYKFKTEPMGHQREALDKFYGLKSWALFLPTQTGKSKTAIDLCVAHRMEGRIKGMLIFTKFTLRGNWVDQIGLHCPIPASVYSPSTDKKREFWQWLEHKHDFKVLIVGWESLSQGGMKQLVEQYIAATGGKLACIGDETTFITGHKADRSKEAVRLAHMCEVRGAMTGTPALEGPMNLYMQFEFLDPEIIGIGDFLAFRNRYAIMGGFMREVRPGLKVPTQIVGYQQLDELMAAVAPYVYQRKKEDILDLPPKRRGKSSPQITKEQRVLYDKVRKEGVMQLRDGSERAVQNVLETALRLHQITGGYGVTPREQRYMGIDQRTKQPVEKIKTVYEPYRIVEPDKNPKIIDLLEHVQEAGKVQGVIWVVYRHEIADIAAKLKGLELRVGELHGGVKEDDRQPMVREFQKGNLQWIVGNASTGGMGYSMPAAEVSLFYNNTFKAIDREQAEDRPWGIGQTKSGIWIDIAAEKTIDVTILKALSQKQDLAEYVRLRINHAVDLLNGDVA